MEGIENTSLNSTDGWIDIRITTVRYLLQHSTFNKDYNILQRSIKKKEELNIPVDNELNRSEHIPPHGRRIHILLIAHWTYYRTDHVLGHKTSIKEDCDHSKYLSRSQQSETRNQQSTETRKFYKHEWIKQHIWEQPLGPRRNQEWNQKMHRDQWK